MINVTHQSLLALPEQLTYTGLNGDDFSETEKFNLPEIVRAMCWIREFCSPSRSFNSRSSYAIKHMMERDIGDYVCNGTAIAAFILSGYEWKPAGDEYNPNAYFKVQINKKEEF